ncbi:MAG: YceD family protein [bacterium]
MTDVTARFHETCDSCGASFMRSVDVPSYTARFVFEDEITKKKESVETEEVVLYIDPKAETINIEDMVVQAILLNDPFVKRCDACTKRLETIDDEDDLDEFQSK